MDILADFANPHAPNFDLLWRQPLVIQIHMLAAVASFAVATWQFIGPKGTVPHRLLGWMWVIFMTTVAVSSFFIREINKGGLSFIHILSVLTLYGLVMLVWHARRRNIKGHAGQARGLYIGALIVAGLFTFMPGRLIWHMFFG
ncbi:DUF2306 domain-containing protein [Asticcacaulis sp. AC402]|uniref:DUF2306 domain-containing protein n=1 Tax=Asticcacaulis sp. AC402 TaxID=1282361 RepID=UPI0003C3BA01|nr:DUF2306 domain-containing protein [Asticcacaulis sp. AC402]ESQ74856.1 hypothetical protein ABAC402_11935 [Asticcacaulis sp. AC402]